MSRLWDKGAPLDERVLRYTAGEDHALDNRLVAYDVQASIAHAEMLAAQGLLSAADLDAIRKALNAIAVEHERGEWRVQLENEDGQTALESLLVARVGEGGKRIHLGRSRNDQVLVALRLYLRDVIGELEGRVLAVAEALDALGARETQTELPGYTHMQQAMPSSVALWAGGFAAELRDDAEGLRQVTRRVQKNPLGSAAGYGTPHVPVDREHTRASLSFDAVHSPVTAVQLSRGKAEAALLFEIATVMQDVGRLASDLLLFYTQEFSFVELPDAFTTGSSIMPQKRNPDVFELIRGRSATAPLFRSIDLCLDTLAILPPALAGVKFRTDRIRLDPSIHAAAEANELVVKQGLPFRDAYRRIAQKLKGK
jgi:argininosuccinate lyase